MLSAHSTGQIHLWDVRKRPQSPDFGIFILYIFKTKEFS